MAGLTVAGGTTSFYFYPNDPGNEPPGIEGGSFKVSRDLGGPAQVKMALLGELTANTELSGKIGLTSPNCTGTAEVTWTAAPEPPPVPGVATSPPLPS